MIEGMKRTMLIPLAAVFAAAAIYGATASDVTEESHSVAGQSVPHAECGYFADLERFSPSLIEARHKSAMDATRQFTALTANSRANVVRNIEFATGQSESNKVIDLNVLYDLQVNGIAPAGRTTDYEFIRRVTLDLTGRIPTSAQVLAFVASIDPNKRAALVDQLLASPQWVDKWTMFYGDLFKNTASATQVTIRPEGRNAFYKWIHDSLAANKPYNQMATEMITAQGTNNFDQTNGQMNYLVLNYTSGGPAQDIFDSQTAGVADQFLGISHVNCLLCHNGLGHLDSLSLWGGHTTRLQAWGQAAFMANTSVSTVALPLDPNATNPPTIRYWSLGKYTTNYLLNTTTGNRPARQPIGTITSVSPTYLFGGQTPAKGDDYRTDLAKFVTSDPQFARAAVNYIWAAMFGMGIVDPPDQFDPARLDPNNPPPAPWTLQPSNPQLLAALTQWFIDNKYDVRGLMRLIANSDTYQLTSEYSGNWDPNWNQHFGRKLVRRMWPEELHDSVITAINTLPTYTVPGFTADSTVYAANSPGFGTIHYAMQAPDVVSMPDGGGAVSQWLDLFLRGNRDDQPRKPDGSVLQALGLMNNTFIESRIQATGTGATASYVNKYIGLTNAQMVDQFFLDVLSRYPTAAESQLATAQIGTVATTRAANAVDLLWTLFNKLDFIFNY